MRDEKMAAGEDENCSCDRMALILKRGYDSMPNYPDTSQPYIQKSEAVQ